MVLRVLFRDYDARHAPRTKTQLVCFPLGVGGTFCIRGKGLYVVNMNRHEYIHAAAMRESVRGFIENSWSCFSFLMRRSYYDPARCVHPSWGGGPRSLSHPPLIWAWRKKECNSPGPKTHEKQILATLSGSDIPVFQGCSAEMQIIKTCVTDKQNSDSCEEFSP